MNPALRHRPITASSPHLWLASASPRRRHLLAQLGFEPRVKVADIEEVRAAGEAPTSYALRLAEQKGRAVRSSLAVDGGSGPDWIVAADTVVVLGQDVLEKPLDVQDAERLLGRLSGASHTVTTAFWFGSVDGEVELCEAIHSGVRFRALDAGEIARYVATGEPMDKAGGYGIQGIGGAFVSRVEGSYFNIVGLPIAELVEAMRRVGALEGFPWSHERGQP